MKTSAWRIVANKNFIVFGIAAGYGRDKYDESATVSGTFKGDHVRHGRSVRPSTGRDVTVGDAQQPLRRSVAQFAVVKLIGEIGQVSGGSFPTPTNTFPSGALVDSRLYASLGLRFGW